MSAIKSVLLLNLLFWPWQRTKTSILPWLYVHNHHYAVHFNKVILLSRPFRYSVQIALSFAKQEKIILQVFKTKAQF